MNGLAPGTRVPEATEPPEWRGVPRDGVRLLVARGARGTAGGNQVEHRVFRHLPSVLSPGDLIVVNTSATLPAALTGRTGTGDELPVHVSAGLDDGRWVVEVRRADNAGPLLGLTAGLTLELSDHVRLRLRRPFLRTAADSTGGTRLWTADVSPATGRVAFLQRYGHPIRYPYLTVVPPLRDYQTVFATHPGSAEMPSAGRPFTRDLVAALAARGVGIAPVVLHTGVSSPEAHEPPSPEPFDVPAATARLVERTRATGGRVVAVGTTVVRALESAAGDDGHVQACAGWTDLVLGPDRPARVVDGLVSGLHEPGASHLQLLESVVGAELVATAYAAALTEGYLWHEFGDSTLLLT